MIDFTNASAKALIYICTTFIITISVNKTIDFNSLDYAENEPKYINTCCKFGTTYPDMEKSLDFCSATASIALATLN